jgi:hypothetical protein
MLAAAWGAPVRGLTPGAVAQLVERLLCKEKVRSSNLLGSTVAVLAYHRKPCRRNHRSTNQEASPRLTSFRMIVRSSPCTSLCRARSRANGEPLKVKRKTKTSFANSESSYRSSIYFENQISVRLPSWAGLDAGLGQATKGARRMPWR